MYGDCIGRNLLYYIAYTALKERIVYDITVVLSVEPLPQMNILDLCGYTPSSLYVVFVLLLPYQHGGEGGCYPIKSSLFVLAHLTSIASTSIAPW
jgi:hypothetical protein